MHQEKKRLSMVIFLIFVHKNVYRIRFQKIKIGPLKGFEKKAFFSLLLMRKRLSGGQKWFLKPYFPLIRGMFVFRSGLRFLFQALGVPEVKSEEKVILVSENDLFLTLGLGTFSARNKNLRPLLNRNIPLISGKYGLRNHF